MSYEKDSIAPKIALKCESSSSAFALLLWKHWRGCRCLQSANQKKEKGERCAYIRSFFLSEALCKPFTRAFFESCAY